MSAEETTPDMQARIEGVMAQVQADFSRKLYAPDPNWAHFNANVPKRSLWSKVKALHWRARERIANAIYPRPDASEFDE